MTNATVSIQKYARLQPDLVAIFPPAGPPITYAGLERKISAAGNRLLRLGIRPGQRVLLPTAPLAVNELAAQIMALALARIGVVACDRDAPGLMCRAMLIRAGTRAPMSDLPTLSYDDSWFDPAPGTVVPEVAMHPGGDAALSVHATSGTTGPARLLEVSHAMMLSRSAREVFYGLPESQRPVLLCSKASASRFRSMISAFNRGGALVFADLPLAAAAIDQHGVTTIMTSLGWLKHLVGALPAGMVRPAALRSICIGGSPLPAPLAEKVAASLCSEVVTRYGATETGTMAIGRREDMRTPFGLGVGRLLPGVDAQAVDASHQPMPRGQEGILRIRTPGMIHGYLDNPGQTRASFHDGWFYPGDIGTVTEDGILVLKGRTSQVINTGLVKVSPHWIDDVLHDFPGVVEAASFGVPDTDGVPVIWAAIVAETPIDIASLQRFCHGRLGPLASPRSVIQLSELPFNASGKVAIGDLVALASRQCGAVQPIGRR